MECLDGSHWRSRPLLDPPPPSANVTTVSVLVVLLAAHLSHQADLLPASRLSEASPMLFGCDLLTKYRPWQIGLTRQEKHKPGDELRTQTRSQIHLFERTRVHILHTQFVSTVCARTHRYDDGHSSVHSKR